MTAKENWTKLTKSLRDLTKDAPAQNFCDVICGLDKEERDKFNKLQGEDILSVIQRELKTNETLPYREQVADFVERIFGQLGKPPNSAPGDVEHLIKVVKMKIGEEEDDEEEEASDVFLDEFIGKNVKSTKKAYEAKGRDINKDVQQLFPELLARLWRTYFKLRA